MIRINIQNAFLKTFKSIRFDAGCNDVECMVTIVNYVRIGFKPTSKDALFNFDAECIYKHLTLNACMAMIIQKCKYCKT